LWRIDSKLLPLSISYIRYRSFNIKIRRLFVT
jgi:hypothetical protein